MGTPSPEIDKRYDGRPDNVMVVNLSLDRDAVQLLREYAPGPKAHGKFVSNLIFEYDRRQSFRDFLATTGREELRKLCRKARKERNT